MVLQDAHILDLDDKQTPLYQRVEQARLFAEFVESSAQQIKARVSDLIVDIDSDCKGLEHFPKAFYTLCLRTVSNIIDGALNDSHDSATAQKEQQAGSDTLLHSLRKLDLAQANEKLALLAAEVGLNLQTDQQIALPSINGAIVSSYRIFKASFEKLVDNIDQQKQSASNLESMLSSASSDYEHIADVNALPVITQKLQLIEDALEDVATDAEAKRQNLRAGMQNGQFDSLRDVPEQLLNPIRGQVLPLQGQLLTIKNNLEAVKSRAVSRVNELLPMLRPLLRSQDQDSPVELKFSDVETLSLNELQLLSEKTIEQWTQVAGSVLEGTDVDLATWQDIFTAVNSQHEPQLTDTQRTALVQKGILKMRLTFVTN